MDLILGSSRLQSLQSWLGGSILPLGILIVVAMMVLPIPPILLDVFFSLNILLGLLVLMVSLHTFRPLDFSSFPTVLLVATVLRLALNVASTRVVLSEGHNGPDAAGKVIEAFGAFVIAGNFVVGLFVFLILVIINLVVITKGAGRVSEVSARFTLDAMPGKQMAIDADLNAGILTPEEATERRAELSRETDFHSAMDGASIGVLQHDLPVGIAAENYVLLSVGDGLAAQIPSLLLSIATAIIVTRVSASHDMAKHISGEVSISRAWFPVAGVLGLIGIIPGMPNVLFLTMAAFSAIVGVVCRVAERRAALEPDYTEEEPQADDSPNKERLDIKEVADNAPITVLLSYPLLSLVDDSAEGGPLVNRITSVRKDVSKSLGFVIPKVRVTDDLMLAPNHYRIRIGQKIVGEDLVYPDRKLALPSGRSVLQLDGIEAKDPSFGMEAIWIRSDQQAEAEANEYVVIEPESVIATHLSQLLQSHASELLGQDDVQAILDHLAEAAPQLVSSVVPKIIPLHTLTGVLRQLLIERIPISDMRRILEMIPELTGKNLSLVELAEALRPALVHLLIQQVVPIKDALPVVTLAPELEQLLVNAARHGDQDSLMLDPSLAQALLQEISGILEELASQNKQALIVVSPVLRRKLASFVRQHLTDVVIISATELPNARKIDIVATISGQAQTAGGA
ncbi:MAG: flagellar biosynthesis protein FlhA [Alphaproteobacteria bacterium]|nr:flagellar biosynthesis protein FlhA [Alphaproteobacteria bacterium]